MYKKSNWFFFTPIQSLIAIPPLLLDLSPLWICMWKSPAAFHTCYLAHGLTIYLTCPKPWREYLIWEYNFFYYFWDGCLFFFCLTFIWTQDLAWVSKFASFFAYCILEKGLALCSTCIFVAFSTMFSSEGCKTSNAGKNKLHVFSSKHLFLNSLYCVLRKNSLCIWI